MFPVNSLPASSIVKCFMKIRKLRVIHACKMSTNTYMLHISVIAEITALMFVLHLLLVQFIISSLRLFPFIAKPSRKLVASGCI
jgi:hypothetical protein